MQRLADLKSKQTRLNRFSRDYTLLQVYLGLPKLSLITPQKWRQVPWSGQNQIENSIKKLTWTISFLFAGLACLLRMMGRPEVTIGVDGSLYRFHPFFHDLMMEKIRTLAPGIRVSFSYFFPLIVLGHMAKERERLTLVVLIFIARL